MKNWIISALLTWIIYRMDFWIRGTVSQELTLAAGILITIAMAVWATDWKIEEIKEKRNADNSMDPGHGAITENGRLLLNDCKR